MYCLFKNPDIKGNTTTIRKKNPGNNIKGQKSRAKTHHKGKISTSFVQKKRERSKKFRQRKNGILKKVNSKLTNASLRQFALLFYIYLYRHRELYTEKIYNICKMYASLFFTLIR